MCESATGYTTVKKETEKKEKGTDMDKLKKV